MKIVFVNRFAWPDHSATSQMLSDLAVGLARAGYDVGVITSRQCYDDPGADLPAHETVGGVAIHRIWTSRFGRGRLAGRALDYLSFYLNAAVAVLRIVGRGDVVVVKTDPPMLSVVVGPLARLRGASVVNWLQDVFPEVAAALGVRGFGGVFGRFARWLRNVSLRRATMNVAIGQRMAARLEAQGVPRDRIAVIHNWADGEMVAPIDHRVNRLRETWCLGEKFVVGYSGNFGRAHEFTTLLDAAEQLRNDPDTVFLFIGGGHQHDAMRAAIVNRGLAHRFVFQPYQPRETLRESLGVPDVHWVSLRPELEGLIVPSKFYGIAAAGRPAIVIGDPDGEIGTVVREAECGVCVRQGDAAGLVAAIGKLQNDQALRERMGRNARNVFEQRYDKSIAIEKWRRLLEGMAVDPGA